MPDPVTYTALSWDDTGDRLYETGVDHGVLYLIDQNGAYSTGIAWNGLSTVTETPSGAEASNIYADNIKYLELRSLEEFGGTIEAYTYPDEFAECDGSVALVSGLYAGQQPRKPFGFSFRSKIGNDVDKEEHGYKLHLIYGCMASPSERSYATINDSPEAITFSWEFTTTPVNLAGHKPVSCLTIDSTKVDSTKLKNLENKLYGVTTTTGTNAAAGSAAYLPLPAEVISTLS